MEKLRIDKNDGGCIQKKYRRWLERYENGFGTWDLFNRQGRCTNRDEISRMDKTTTHKMSVYAAYRSVRIFVLRRFAIDKSRILWIHDQESH
ncbi:hypothetical protein AR158_c407L [Paramecium bursaria Chlorella virus AR158]|uniref:hypothetical protein n=1 Tax=Paramecium bursaria Chlorella virus AR158 TaxID=380598 RepID=UPI00015AA6BF|nr:hypothetical protein AR158_c407L [Paramecium bursaria Chlorella virus AR158]ABU43952.1 hypothetical protein AR158_c407L [Paramecium bursaria Chlorella virus AR158]